MSDLGQAIIKTTLVGTIAGLVIAATVPTVIVYLLTRWFHE